MSLADFVQEHVFPAENDQFVVRQDLLDAFTQWRQQPEKPIMQLSDLEQANNSIKDALPVQDFKSTLLVAGPEGQKGTLSDCWVGWKMDWPGGNKTQPTPAKMELSQPLATPALRRTHFCFHFNTQDGYDRSQLETYIRSRVSKSAPDDIGGLDQELEAAYNRLAALDRRGTACWRLESVEHEGLVFNVFVAYKDGLHATAGTSNHVDLDALFSLSAGAPDLQCPAADDGDCDIC